MVALNEQLRRLNVIYIAGNISDEDYASETKRIRQQLDAARTEVAEDKPANIEALKSFLASDFLTIYHTLEKEDRRRMWRSVIEEIYVEGTTITGIKPRL